MGNGNDHLLPRSGQSSWSHRRVSDLGTAFVAGFLYFPSVHFNDIETDAFIGQDLFQAFDQFRFRHVLPGSFQSPYPVKGVAAAVPTALACISLMPNSVINPSCAMAGVADSGSGAITASRLFKGDDISFQYMGALSLLNSYLVRRTTTSWRKSTNSLISSFRFKRIGSSPYDGYVIYSVWCLEFGMLVQLVDHHLRHGISFSSTIRCPPCLLSSFTWKCPSRFFRCQFTNLGRQLSMFTW